MIQLSSECILILSQIDFSMVMLLTSVLIYDNLITSYNSETLISILNLSYLLSSALQLQKAFVIHWVHLGQFASVEEAYNDGMHRLDTLVSRLHSMVM